MDSNLAEVNTFLACTVGIVVFFVGMHVNQRVAFLRTFNIPESVTGGILAAVAVLLLYLVFDLQRVRPDDARSAASVLLHLDRHQRQHPRPHIRR